MNALTAESIAAIRRRKTREQMARNSAERRFSAEQYLIGNRKRKRRALLLSAATVLAVLGAALDFEHRLAQAADRQAGTAPRESR